MRSDAALLVPLSLLALLIAGCAAPAPTGDPLPSHAGQPATTTPGGSGPPGATGSAPTASGAGTASPTPAFSALPTGASPSVSPSESPVVADKGPIAEVASRLPAALTGYAVTSDVRVASSDDVMAELARLIAAAPPDEAAEIVDQRDRLVENGLAGRAGLDLTPAAGRPLEAQVDLFATAAGAADDYAARLSRFRDCERHELGRTALRAAAYRCPIATGAAVYAVALSDVYVLTVAAPVPPDAELAAEFAGLLAALTDLAAVLAP